MSLLDAHTDLGANVDGHFLKFTQTIPDDFVSSLRDELLLNSSRRAGELHRCASVPTVVVEKWLREGFDIYQETPKAILKRLRDEGLDSFITSNKVV